MRIKKLMASFCCAAVLLSCLCIPAASAPILQAGETYTVSGELSCWVSAMGGNDFATGMLSGIRVNVDQSGNARMTLSLGASHGSIYTVDFIAFVDAEKSPPGYYDESGILHKDAAYTIGSNAAVDSEGNSVRYVDSVTFPIAAGNLKSSYCLYLYIESNVMGLQFCDGSGSGASNTPDVLTPYAAILTVDWNTLSSGPDRSGSQSTAVTYTADVSAGGIGGTSGTGGTGASGTGSPSGTAGTSGTGSISGSGGTAYASGTGGTAGTTGASGAGASGTAVGHGEFLFTIPDRIVVDSGTTFVYQLELTGTSLSAGKGLQAVAPESVILTDGKSEKTARCNLGDSVVLEPGETVFGVVMLSDSGSPDGIFTGTMDFTVACVKTETE